jgi:hypothetical protein
MKMLTDKPTRAGMLRTMYGGKAPAYGPIFSWMEEGKERRCPLNETLNTESISQS